MLSPPPFLDITGTWIKPKPLFFPKPSPRFLPTSALIPSKNKYERKGGSIRSGVPRAGLLKRVGVVNCTKPVFSRSQPVNSYEWFKNFVSADETRINYVVSTLHREVKSKLPV